MLLENFVEIKIEIESRTFIIVFYNIFLNKFFFHKIEKKAGIFFVVSSFYLIIHLFSIPLL